MEIVIDISGKSNEYKISFSFVRWPLLFTKGVLKSEFFPNHKPGSSEQTHNIRKKLQGGL